ncbi:MAG: acyl-CoA synthetase [Thermohalobaculum sp.]|nr:acyl-CoA synthetase [Thermohalobaculum sp.]
MADADFVWATLAQKQQVETVPAGTRWPDATVYGMLAQTAACHPSRSAVSFQLKGGPDDPAETLDWAALAAQVTQAANLFRRLGVGDGDAVAFVLPNATETVLALIGGMTVGIVSPVNPLLETAQIAAILRESGAKVVVTLAPFPKTDIAQKVHAAVADAPGVETILEVDLKRYLKPPLAWLIPFLRPRVERRHKARVLDFRAELAKERADRLDFAEDRDLDRIAATFHTGGTTGHPKIARHHQRGMVYNGRIGALCLIGAEDVLICPLPLFHVLAAYPVTMTALASGAHLVLPTPAGFRGEGVLDNFWKLVARWRVSFMVMVPTAASALMQRAIDADVSSLKYALCGSAPLPVELFRRFEAATGVRILEGYGMTEATCLVSINPPGGERKIGSVGLPIPYTDVAILICGPDGTVMRTCGTDEVGEICVRSPGVFPGYKDHGKNAGLFAQPGGWLRTGDLGRIDADGYIWITGRAKDLIIRGGHNIDPAIIEEALVGHPAVAFVGAIGQPDAHAGEVPCAYVELAAGATVTEAELLEFAAEVIAEKAALPKTIEILDELPKTAVGKIFKPDLRKRATARIYTRALLAAGIRAEVTVVEDPKLGLTAEVAVEGPNADAQAIEAVLGVFARPWRLRW